MPVSRPQTHEEAKFLDRCALAFLSAISAFPLAWLLWALICGVAWNLELDWRPFFQWVLAFTGLMAIMGFMLLENLVLNAVAAIWRAIFRAFDNFDA